MTTIATTRDAGAAAAPTLRDRIAHMRPCGGAVAWLGDQTDPALAWAKCDRGDWMLWIAARLGVDRRLVGRAKVDCARTALPYVREEDLLAVLLALHVAEEFAAGRAGEDDCWAAADAAAAAADDAAAQRHMARLVRKHIPTTVIAFALEGRS